MYGARYLSIKWLTKLIRKPGFWLILALLVLITLPHYGEAFEHPAFLIHMMTNLGLDRHAFERILYLAPIVWAGFLFGWKGSAVTSLVALACMLPRAILMSLYLTDALFEISAVFIIGNVLTISFQDHVQVIQENERRLTALHQISSTVSQSLELNHVLSDALDNVIDVMQVEIALVFLLDENAGELALAAHRGVSAGFVQNIDKLKLGEAAVCRGCLSRPRAQQNGGEEGGDTFPVHCPLEIQRKGCRHPLRCRPQAAPNSSRRTGVGHRHR